jgi:hypothetical protein
MEIFPEYQFLINGDAGFEEGSIPFKHLNYQTYTKNTDIDVQIVCTHLAGEIGKENPLSKIEREFQLPTVWVEYGVSSFQPKVRTPLIYTSISNHRKDYPSNLMRHVYAVPSKTLWSKPWIGDEKKIFVPLRKPLFAHLDKEQNAIINYLQKNNIKIEFSENTRRDIPFEEWQKKFIHSRVLLEITNKTASTILSEGMVIGMPIITFNRNEYKYQIRNEVDGFITDSPQEIYSLCKKMLDDYEYAKEMGHKAKERADVLFDQQIIRQVWNTAFEDAIKIVNSQKKN